MIEEELRRRFESLNRDSYSFRRSRKGNYVNPAIARDWKWFRQGHQAQLEVPNLDAAAVAALPVEARAYIHQLATNADPSGMVRENMQLRDTNAGLQIMYRKATDGAQAVVDAATALVKEVCERHDTRNPPHKYAVPYGAVVTLMESLKLKAEGT